MPPRKIADTGKKVLCPMPGLVVSIAVKEGQEVIAFLRSKDLGIHMQFVNYR
jgi:uncharacterized protein YajQ (UPF0234 family)